MPAWDGLVCVLVAVWAALVEVKTCGRAGEAGRLAEGYPADPVIVDGDLSVDIRL